MKSLSFQSHIKNVVLQISNNNLLSSAEILSPPSSLTGQSESVRDVQFSMKDYFTFAASFENGNVQLWDIRRPDRYERMFTAHTGPVFCCDWHPDDRWEKLTLWHKLSKNFQVLFYKVISVHCIYCCFSTFGKMLCKRRVVLVFNKTMYVPINGFPSLFLL